MGAISTALQAVLETPSNPLLHIADIAAIATLAKPGVELFVDGTFASPALQSPLALGATLSIHSATKFLGGHSDVMGGVASGRRELIAKLREMQILLGTVLDPHAAWLLMRGVRTLGVRVRRQSESALALARKLASHPAVDSVSSRRRFIRGSRRNRRGARVREPTGAHSDRHEPGRRRDDPRAAL
jgi:cystathionine beta-lyase/cystathionine gamma-synthase